MRSFRLIPDGTHIAFVRYRYPAYVFSIILVLLSCVLLPTKGLNYGIDFRGGILVEVGMPPPAADVAAMRSTLNNLGLGEVALQTIGNDPMEVTSDSQAPIQCVCSPSLMNVAPIDRRQNGLLGSFAPFVFMPPSGGQTGRAIAERGMGSCGYER